MDLVNLSDIISWIHLSDLHTIKGDPNYDSVEDIEQELSFKLLYNDIKELLTKFDIKLNYLIITGDLSNKGAGDYDSVQKIINNLLKVTKLNSIESVLVVPGNHDVDRNKITENGKCFREYLDDDNKLNRFMNSSYDERKLVFIPMEKYYNYLKNNFTHLGRVDINDLSYVIKDERLGKEISFLGFNSTWLSIDDLDEGKLIIGEKQVKSAINQTYNSYIRIALMHHPPTWFKRFDIKSSIGIIKSNCNIILHGHLHEYDLSYYKLDGENKITLCTGTCNLKEGNKYSYNIVQLNIRNNEGKIYIREFDKKQKKWDYYKNKNIYDFKILSNTQFIPYIEEGDISSYSTRYEFDNFLESELFKNNENIIAKKYYSSIISIFIKKLKYINLNIPMLDKIRYIKEIIYNSLEEEVFDDLIIHSQNVSQKIINDVEREIICLCFITYIIGLITDGIRYE